VNSLCRFLSGEQAQNHNTHHPPFPPPNTKSIRLHERVSFGAVKPVNVAWFADTARRGVWARRSCSTKGGEPGSTANFPAKSAGRAPGGRTPVVIS
jgi:hypothetical protein